MSHDTSPTDSSDRGTDTSTGPAGRTSRRTFLKATAAGTVAGGLAATTVGTVAGRGIPTPFLERDGNLIKDPSGNEVILRGVNIADPRRINETAAARGKTTEQVIDYATDPDAGWYARVIRLPIHPGDVAGLPPIPEADTSVHDPITFSESELETYCEEHLDPAVQKCKEVGAYAIVDYHRHWGTGTLPWDDPTLSEEVNLFWDVVAPRYADQDHVIYEMYNEPTHPQMGTTPIENEWSADIWRDWIDTCQPWIDTIREHSDNLTIVGSPMWSQYPEGALVEEPEGDNLGYTYHIYPTHGISQDENWDNNANGEGVSQCYEEVPLFVTEFGWQDGSPTGSGTVEGFGEPFYEWLNDNPIHWTGWCFDPTWLPSAVKRSFEAGGAQDSVGDPYSEEIPVYCEDLPCEWEPRPDPHMGEYLKQQLADQRNDDVPQGDGTTNAPSAPSSVSIGETTESTVAVEWSGVSDADEYVVTVDGEEFDATAETSLLVTDLAPETEYTIGVAASNADGESSSTTVMATTGGGEHPCEAAGAEMETLDDGSTVCDVDGDGNYRDVTGDGSVTNSDVTEFFGNQHADPWDSRTDLFDFDGDDNVGQSDVVALFEYLGQ